MSEYESYSNTKGRQDLVKYDMYLSVVGLVGDAITDGGGNDDSNGDGGNGDGGGGDGGDDGGGCDGDGGGV